MSLAGDRFKSLYTLCIQHVYYRTTKMERDLYFHEQIFNALSMLNLVQVGKAQLICNYNMQVLFS